MQTLVFPLEKMLASPRRHDGTGTAGTAPTHRIDCTRYHHPSAQPLAAPDDYFGNTTVSITWITPFEARMSVFTTLALSTDTAPPFVENVSD